MLIIAIAIYLVATFLLTAFKIESQEQGIKIFFLSVIVTPLYALFVYLKNSKKTSRIDYYYCSECDYVFPVKLKHCPICEERGKIIKLRKYENPHNLKPLYEKLTLA